ncbi:MAG: class I SAM-dependent methyltransferase [Actinomycetota bacterium]|nr:class I SAM-dependent methyltransferase [Actinomycetota bacterium]
MPDEIEAQRMENRNYWERVVDIHYQSKFYEVDRWIVEGMRMRPWEEDVIGRLDGKNVVHLQCHFGKDTLSLLSLGASSVTGIDFSESAIAKAVALSAKTGCQDRSNFIVCSVEEVPMSLPSRKYDMAYVSLGAINWIPKIETWAAALSHLLKDNSTIFIHEVHPLSQVIAPKDSKWTIEDSYFETSHAMTDESIGSYVEDSESLGTFRTFLWNHSLGEIVLALAKHGFSISLLDEHHWTSFLQYPEMEMIETERYVLPDSWVKIPLSFTMVASRSGLRP